MKRQLTVVLGLAILATPAFATKARLQALGEDIYGSNYINDNRNIWLNPAQINNHKDLVTFEWGQASGEGSASDIDRTSTPRAEGGVYKSIGNLVYGVHLGGASNSANGLRLASNVPATEENNLDLFVGGDSGFKWGANLGYSKSGDDESNNDANQESMRTRLGVIMGDLQVYTNISLANKAEVATREYDGKLGYQIGAIQSWNGNSVFADYRSLNAEGNIGAGDKDIKFQQFYIGIGRVERLNDSSNLFLKAQYQMVKAENDVAGLGFGVANSNCDGLASAPFCNEYKTSRIPVVVGLETEATSWLTLRASVGQVVWGSEEDDTNERPVKASTIVNAGASLKFGELTIDGVIGNNSDVITVDGASGDGSGSNEIGDSTSGGRGALRTDTLMTRVGMTYRF